MGSLKVYEPLPQQTTGSLIFRKGCMWQNEREWCKTSGIDLKGQMRGWRTLEGGKCEEQK